VKNDLLLPISQGMHKNGYKKRKKQQTQLSELPATFKYQLQKMSFVGSSKYARADVDNIPMFHQ